jgi:peroxisomal 2,4-dienoyl-CoA reductase
MSSSPFNPTACAGRVALVTGGGSGIGLGIARRLGEHGTSLVLMGRREEFLKGAQTMLKKAGVQNVVWFSGDVRKEEDARAAVKLAVDTFGGLDTLVNCAAGNFLSLAEDLTLKGMRTVLDIDLLGTYNMSREAFPYLKASKRGSIINITATLHYQVGGY